MTRIAVIAEDAPHGAGPYAPAVIAGQFVYLSGIGALHPETHEIVGATIEEQTHHTMRNIVAILRACGATLDHVVKMSVYLQDPDDYEGFNTTYGEYFEPPFPARLTVGAGQVWDMLIKMDCVAYLGDD